MPRPIPERPALEGLEEQWSKAWEQEGTHRFDRSAALSAGSDRVYAIDTPPPTASGSLHIGHVFSYTHMDLAARFQRMRGKHLFYPMGWDDNGLPTERRVQNYYGVRCDPTLPYVRDLEPPMQGGENASAKAADQIPVSRRNFIELCDQLTVEDERQFEDLWRRLGLSVDWSLTYRTIDETSRLTAQLAFLRNLARGEAYQSEAPSLWDVTFRTAVAQAELEDKDQPGAMHRIVFHRPDGSTVEVDTTRPELIAADVALVAHPDDERYRDLIGTTVTTPVFGAEITVYAHHLAQPDKGTGIAMASTWGDLTDVTWWRDLQLPTRAVIGRDGRLIAEPSALEYFTPAGRNAYSQLAGLTPFSARARMVELLRDSKELIGEPVPLTHPVKFFEKGDKPLEIVSTRQWYIANGSRDAALRERLVSAGRSIAFHPDHMRVRYENWIGGLTGDWLISRQRFFGVPIPVWYRLESDGTRGEVLTPAEDSLPIDPSSDVPEGYSEADRGVPGGFEGDLDIMDTWATSSLTPQIAGGWASDPELFDLVFPFDLRSQGQDIIRTWLFSTVLRAELEHGTVPWKDAGISGFIVDPDRKKMSKSKGNVVTPSAMLEEHGSDAVRYWAASSRLGSDASFDPQNPKLMKIGRRLAIKVLNAAKFVHGFQVPEGAVPTEPLDLDLLAELAIVVTQATAAYEAYDHARALEVTEQFFWMFCDDYLEVVKERAYGSGANVAGQASAAVTLHLALETLLLLLAPVIPFATEEVWRWSHDTSIHLSNWPTAADVSSSEPSGLLRAVSEALIAIRRVKTDAKVSQRTEIATASIIGPEILAAGIADLGAAGRISDLKFQPDMTAATAVATSEISITNVVWAEVAQ